MANRGNRGSHRLFTRSVQSQHRGNGDPEVPRPLCSRGPHLNPLPQGEADAKAPGEGKSTRVRNHRQLALKKAKKPAHLLRFPKQLARKTRELGATRKRLAKAPRCEDITAHARPVWLY